MLRKIFKKKYSNENFSIQFSTNNEQLLSLVDNYIDLKEVNYSKRKFHFDIDIFLLNKKQLSNRKNEIYPPKIKFENVNWPESHCNNLADVRINKKKRKIVSVIFNFEESQKENLLYFSLFKPLRQILQEEGLYCIHSAVVEKNNTSIFICGPQNSGKSSSAYLFSKIGYKILSDDDCFIQNINNSSLIYPFPTKMGVKEELIKSQPEIRKFLLEKYKYGNKKRASLKEIYGSNKSSYKTKVIIFPRFNQKEKFTIRKAPRKWITCKLFNENFDDQEKQNEKSYIKAFLSYFALAKDALCFEILYNKNTLKRIPPAIERILKRKKQF